MSSIENGVGNFGVELYICGCQSSANCRKVEREELLRMAAAAATAVPAMVDGMFEVEDGLVDILDGGETEGDLMINSCVGVLGSVVDIGDARTSLLVLLPFTTADRVQDCSGDTISVISMN